MMMLCIIAGGYKLPSYIILSRKTICKSEMFPEDVIVHAQKDEG
jgi:hypothetical protein